MHASRLPACRACRGMLAAALPGSLTRVGARPSVPPSNLHLWRAWSTETGAAGEAARGDPFAGKGPMGPAARRLLFGEDYIAQAVPRASLRRPANSPALLQARSLLHCSPLRAQMDAAFLLTLVAAAAAARRTASSAARRTPADAPRYVPGTVLVRLKPAPAAAAAAAGSQPNAPLAGLQLVGVQGDHHSMPAGGGTAGGGASSKAPATAAAAPRLPTGAVLRFRITDATSVEAKVAQLRANAGMQLHGTWQFRRRLRWIVLLHGLWRCSYLTPACSSVGPTPTTHQIGPCSAAVAAAQPDYLYYPQRVPKDRFFPPFDVWAGLWHLRAIRAPQAWDTTTGSKA